MTAINDQLKCQILHVLVDIERHVTRIVMADGNCTDMQGAIDFATRIDPDVTEIDTATRMMPDTKYKLINGEWKAIPYMPPKPPVMENANAIREQAPSV